MTAGVSVSPCVMKYRVLLMVVVVVWTVVPMWKLFTVHEELSALKAMYNAEHAQCAEMEVTDKKLQEQLERQVFNLNSSASIAEEALARARADSEANLVLHTTPYWMLVVIPTTERSNGFEYLEKTLLSIISQLPVDTSDPLYGRLGVVVRCSVPAGETFRALQARIAHPDVYFHAPSTAPGRMGPKFAAHARDVVALLGVALSLPSAYVMFAEDDFVWCPNSLPALQYLVRKATKRFSSVAAYRVSYGLNGFIVPTAGGYLEDFVQTLSASPGKTPVDLLAATLLLDSGKYVRADRPLVAFRYNLMHHEGVQSLLNKGAKRYTPECWQLLNDWLGEKEFFRFDLCPADDISPCAPPGAGEEEAAPLIDWDMKPRDMCRIHFPTCPKGTAKEQARELNCRSSA